MVERVVKIGEFHETDDFEVNLIKFTKNLRIPLTKDNSTDYTYVSTDCFHLSQKGHSFFAMNIWNQILTKENERRTDTSFDYNDFKCPTVQHPYIRTRSN